MCMFMYMCVCLWVYVYVYVCVCVCICICMYVYMYVYVCGYMMADLITCVLVSELRTLVVAILDYLPQIGRVVVLMFFIFFLFAVLGLQSFSGVMHQKCFSEDTLITEDTENLCSLSSYGRQCDNEMVTERFLVYAFCVILLYCMCVLKGVSKV